MSRRAPRRGTAALSLLVGLGSMGCWIERAPSADGAAEDTASVSVSVREMMEAAADAWNRGELAAFMSDYQRSPETTYIGGVGLVRGWEGILARYAPLFVPGAERDSLRFRLLETRQLGQRHGLALVRYFLYRPASPADSARAEDSASAAPADAGGSRVVSTGLVTLVLLRVEGRWEIVHDHSSAEAPADSAAEPSADTVAPTAADSRPAGGAASPAAGARGSGRTRQHPRRRGPA